MNYEKWQTSSSLRLVRYKMECLCTLKQVKLDFCDFFHDHFRCSLLSLFCPPLGLCLFLTNFSRHPSFILLQSSDDHTNSASTSNSASSGGQADSSMGKKFLLIFLVMLTQVINNERHFNFLTQKSAKIGKIFSAKGKLKQLEMDLNLYIFKNPRH